MCAGVRREVEMCLCVSGVEGECVHRCKRGCVCRCKRCVGMCTGVIRHIGVIEEMHLH